MSSCFVDGMEFDLNYILNMEYAKFHVCSTQSVQTKLYKYRPVTPYSMSDIMHGTVFMQNPSNFNDPYDTYLNVDQEKVYIETARYYLRLAGIEYADDDKRDALLYRLALHVYSKLHAGEETFFLRSGLTEEQCKNCEIFELSVMLAVHKDAKDDILRKAIHEFLSKQFWDSMNIVYRNFGVCCFSKRQDNMLLWSHYADSHKGICIEYDIPPFDASDPGDQLCASLFPVIYSEQMGDVTQEVIKDMQGKRDKGWVGEMYRNGILRKGIDWKYEDEWRFIDIRDGKNQRDEKGFSLPFCKISKIYLGCKMRHGDRKKIIELCGKKGISYAGMRASPDSYRMVECMQSCEYCDRYRLVPEEETSRGYEHRVLRMRLPRKVPQWRRKQCDSAT